MKIVTQSLSAWRPAAVLLIVLLCVGWIPSNSTAKNMSPPAYAAPGALTRSHVTVDPVGEKPSATLAPFLNIVPSGDGTELFIQAGEVGELSGTVVSTIDLGPTHNKGSYTMTYSDTTQAYFATALGFTPNTSQAGSINITTTFGLDTGAVDFYRAFVPASTTQTISSQDGNMELTLVTTNTISFDTYVAVVPSFAPPAAAPVGHRFVGSIYSVRAADALVTTDKPMSLRIHYSELALDGADPHTLAIFSWDALGKRWVNLGGRLNVGQRYLSIATSRFGSYALMTTPAWRDDFNDTSGLALMSGVTRGAGTVVLLDSPGNGTATSKIITPTTAFASWSTLTFTVAVNPPTTLLTVDVLSANGDPLLTNVASGASLASIDPANHPALTLRAHLASTVAGQTPTLDAWQLRWVVERRQIYLPLVRK
jgi:hypothetical protein